MSADADSKGEKTYVWVKLRDGAFSPGGGGGGAPHRHKKRGAPSSNGSNEVWGWAPGHYSSIAVAAGAAPPASGGEEEEEAAAGAQYRFTLLGLDGNDAKGERDGDDFGRSEHTLSGESTRKLLESGDIVLANPWEGYDFVNRLELGGGGDDDGDDESEYDYDDDSDSDDEDGRVSREVNINPLLDVPEDSPPSNLIELTHLHEPSVVHALRRRYENTRADMSSIYTDTGPILLAVNPFKHDETGVLYGEETVRRYRLEGEGRWMKDRPGNVGAANKNMSADENEEIADGDSPSLPPHVYSVADRTFRTMMTRLHPPVDVAPSSSSGVGGARPGAPPPQAPSAADRSSPKVNQSVLVSGESGSGKTVTTKLLMAYLSKLSASPDDDAVSASGDNDDGGGERMSIERRILESNPIMESFGNARTIRNDNSSRFGKYIEMKFVSDRTGGDGAGPGFVPGATLASASVETYLLEKVRLVHQSPGERNYHIFYELFSMKYDDHDVDEEGDSEVDDGPSVVERIGLLDYDMEDFRLINASNTYDRRDGVADAETFRDMKRAMSVMGFAPPEVRAVFEVTSALLHASNLTFERIGEVECALERDNPHLDYVCNLLGITEEGLNSALCYYKITIGGTGRKGGETHRRELSMDRCEKGVEALIKATYGAMFEHLVKRINASVSGDGGNDGVGGGKAPRGKRRGMEKEASIGILDIFGFESFQVNSFEQLCINYCNESLQQQFNRFVLRNEQEEYDREGIPWSFIDFPENQDVLDLIDFKGTGILHILHDQCRTPGASDRTFALAMYDKCSRHGRFEADSRQVAEQLFAVHHYAGLVEYDVGGFVEKTRDELPKSGSDLLLASTNDFVKTLAETLQPTSSAASKGRKMLSPSRGGAAQRPTVGIQFSSQLHSLREKIDDTSPHYIRCLKPNNLLVPDCFDAALIADQLRCAGVIEAVRVSRLGYPQRFSHSQFIARYRILGRKLKKKNATKKYNPAKALLHSITQRLNSDQSDVGIQVGKTKVFMRRQAYDLLEKMRRGKVTSATIAIQKNGRRYVCQKLFANALGSVLAIQCCIRRTLAEREVTGMRRQHNSVIMQRSWRKYAARKYFSSANTIARWCQIHQRGSIGRKKYNELNRKRKAVYLQSQWRCYLGLKSFRKQINAVLIIQCAARCYSARVELTARKADARDFAAVVQERDNLRLEVIALRNELQKVKDESAAQQSKKPDDAKGGSSNSGEVDTENQSFSIALEQVAKDEESAKIELIKAEKDLAAFKSERDLIADDRDDVKQVNKMLQTEMNSRDEELRTLKKEIKKMKKVNGNLSENSYAQETLSVKVDSTDTARVVELEEELNSLRETNASLQRENNLLKDANSTPSPNALEELEHLREANASLQKENDQWKNENSTLRSNVVDDEFEQLKKANASLQQDNDYLNNVLNGIKKDGYQSTRRSSDTSKPEKDAGERSLPTEKKIPRIDADKSAAAIEERSPGAVNPSVCTSFTVDMDMSEEEVTRLRDENFVLRKQLELLRVNSEFQSISDDQEYDESVAPESGSNATEYIGEANALPENALPESVMRQICSEVETVTEEVILKTRAESQSKIAKLESEIKELRAEMERNKKHAKYDLDDMTRVNRSLRGDLEKISEEQMALDYELQLKCEELESLNEDIDRFAETFASQHDELQQLESRTKKLKLEKDQLQALDADKMKRIQELEIKLEKKQSEWVGSEIGKIWDEIGRLNLPPSSTPSFASPRSERRSERRKHSTKSSSSDSSSEE